MLIRVGHCEESSFGVTTKQSQNEIATPFGLAMTTLNKFVSSQRSKVFFDKPPKGLWHRAFWDKSRRRKGDLNSQLSPFFINLPARILPVDLFIKGPEHGATLSSQFFLKPLVQACRQMTDTSVSGSHGSRPAVKDPKDQDSGGQGPAHASGRSPFHSCFVGFDRASSTMKPRRHLRRIGFNFQFENVCDRSEDGFTSMVSFLTVRIGQSACLFRKGRDSPGFDLVPHGLGFNRLPHFSISSS